MHHFMWKNAVKIFPTLTASLPHPSQTIPHPFRVKTEKGIETRLSYIASDFVDVVALLADELSKFVDYWQNVPKFVEEEVSKSAKLLRNELEVLSTSLHRLLDIYLASSIGSNVFEPVTSLTSKKPHKDTYMISAVLLAHKSPHSVERSTILLKSVPKRSRLLGNIRSSTSAICPQLQPSSVL